MKPENVNLRGRAVYVLPTDRTMSSGIVDIGEDFSVVRAVTP
jgi:hypothetical protein